MTNEEILLKVSQIKHGVYVKFTKIKIFDHEIVKVSNNVGRLGINYANMKSSENKEVGKLRWGEWLEGYEGLVIKHKGALYLRVAITYNIYHNKSKYYRGSEEITKEEATKLLGESKTRSNKCSVYNVKFDNIVSIG